MCGRFSLTVDADTLAEELGLIEVAHPETLLRYNIAPSQNVAVITDRDPERIQAFRWGLVPAWAKDPAVGPRMINARAESLADKPAFRSALRRRRCLVPADGYYEWKRGGSGKQPMYVHLTSGRPFTFAGLFEMWRGPDGSALFSCTVVTAEAAGPVAEVHGRMPVIVPPGRRALWLDRSVHEPSTLRPALESTPVDALRLHPVSTLVNSPDHDDPACIEPVAPEPPVQGSLFDE